MAHVEVYFFHTQLHSSTLSSEHFLLSVSTGKNHRVDPTLQHNPLVWWKTWSIHAVLIHKCYVIILKQNQNIQKGANTIKRKVQFSLSQLQLWWSHKSQPSVMWLCDWYCRCRIYIIDVCNLAPVKDCSEHSAVTVDSESTWISLSLFQCLSQLLRRLNGYWVFSQSQESRMVPDGKKLGRSCLSLV